MRKTLLALIARMVLCVVTSGFAWGQESANDFNIIGDKLNTSLENGGTLAVICYMNATEAWDAELNKTYKALRDQIDPEVVGLLKETQQKWMAFRDANESLAAALINGTIRQELAAQAKYENTRERALVLKDYLVLVLQSK